MAKQTVETMIEGGKATAAPPLGPALGPTGVNIGLVIAEINKKTADMKGMQVPVKVMIDTETKTFSIEIGTPPASALIKKEAGVEKAASNPLQEKVADLKIQQVIKIAKIKEDSLLGKDLKAKVREIVGSCQSMGILVEGLPAQEALKAIAAGKFDAQIASGRTEFEAKAKQMMKEMEGKENKKIRTAMADAGIPSKIIDELIPPEKKEAAAAGGGKRGKKKKKKKKKR